MPQIVITMEMPIYPMTHRAAYAMGWNRGYGFKDHALCMPPLAGCLLDSFEEGLTKGEADADYDRPTVTFYW